MHAGCERVVAAGGCVCIGHCCLYLHACAVKYAPVSRPALSLVPYNVLHPVAVCSMTPHHLMAVAPPQHVGVSATASGACGVVVEKASWCVRPLCMWWYQVPPASVCVSWCAAVSCAWPWHTVWLCLHHDTASPHGGCSHPDTSGCLRLLPGHVVLWCRGFPAGMLFTVSSVACDGDLCTPCNALQLCSSEKLFAWEVVLAE